jgi:hypothetical protein
VGAPAAHAQSTASSALARLLQAPDPGAGQAGTAAAVVRRYFDISGSDGGDAVTLQPAGGGPPLPASASGRSALGPDASPELVQDVAALVAGHVESRVVARLEAWKREELDEHVLRLVEDRLQEETERRSWRRGPEVF